MNGKLASLRRLLALSMTFVGVLLQTALYAYVWFEKYYPLIRLKLKFYFKGHILILLIYVVLLLVFTKVMEGNRVGDSKPMDVIMAQMFALIGTNMVSYIQLSLMRNWLLKLRPMVGLLAAQLVVTTIWVYLSDYVYKKAFPPKDLLLVHGTRSIEDIVKKFESRPDKYKIRNTICVEQGLDAITAEMRGDYGAVVLWDIPTELRNELMKVCYAEGIRMYVMPKIPDVLMQGSIQIHLFDTPLYLTREYAMTFGQRFIKRTIDLVCAVILLVLTSPIFLVTAILIHAYDKGPVFYKQVRCTKDMKEFEIYKFRSMIVNAEKNGVAQLAKQNDSRITPVGAFIRKCRIDELPQLINVIRGDMSFIGPRPERPAIIKQYMEEMPEFAYRVRVKAGLGGYAQVYGKYNTTPYDKLKLDLTYIQNYSLWLDLKLMLMTLKILITPESTEGVADDQTTALKK